jgi:hypothetical protein
MALSPRQRRPLPHPLKHCLSGGEVLLVAPQDFRHACVPLSFIFSLNRQDERRYRLIAAVLLLYVIRNSKLSLHVDEKPTHMGFR